MKGHVSVEGEEGRQRGHTGSDTGAMGGEQEEGGVETDTAILAVRVQDERAESRAHSDTGDAQAPPGCPGQQVGGR